jgi:hypothetical protein
MADGIGEGGVFDANYVSCVGEVMSVQYFHSHI